MNIFWGAKLFSSVPQCLIDKSKLVQYVNKYVCVPMPHLRLQGTSQQILRHLTIRILVHFLNFLYSTKSSMIYGFKVEQFCPGGNMRRTLLVICFFMSSATPNSEPKDTCKFTRDCKQHWFCRNIADAYCKCNFGKCVTVGVPFYRPQNWVPECKDYTDCDCK